VIVDHCQRCGGRAAVEPLTVNGEVRHRVQCFGCHRMTLHKPTPADAVREWGVMQAEHATRSRRIGED
jgi:hypothetical protein